MASNQLYNPSKIKDKFHFGIYLNLAQHNAFVILNDINEKLGAKSNVSEENLYQSKCLEILKENKPEEQIRVLNLITEYFPFTRLFLRDAEMDSTNEIDKAKLIYWLIYSLLKRLDEERNFYSHFKNQSRHTCVIKTDENSTDTQFTFNQIQKNFTRFLGENDSEQRKVAVRLYPNLLNTDIEVKKKSKKTKTLKGFDALKELQKENDKNDSNSNPQLSNPVYSKFIEKVAQNHNLWDIENPAALSTKGLSFLICLFLERKYANLFISKVEEMPQLSEKTSLIEELEKAMYLHYCCHLPQPRLESADITLDMLNELNRSPKELYPILSDKNKAYFHREISYTDGSVLIENEDGELMTIQKMVRHQDRFPYFALRYLDEHEAFSKIHFQTYIGKLVLDNYEKKMQGTAENRLLLKELYGFEKLTKLNTKFFEDKNWKLNKNTESENNNENATLEGQVVQFSPHYHFSGTDGGRIAFKLGNSFVPTISKNEEKSQEKNRNVYEAEGAKPDFYISVSELPQLFLFGFLAERSDSLFILLNKYKSQYLKFCKDLKEGKINPVSDPNLKRRKVKKKDLKKLAKDKYLPYTEEHALEVKARKDMLEDYLLENYKGMVHYWHLSDEVLRYLIGFAPANYKAEVLHKIKSMRDENAKMIQKLERTKEKIEENDEKVRLKQGKIADWLANDMIYFKPLLNPNDKNNPKQGKPNNDQFRRLQKMLALYGGHKNELLSFFKELNLIGNNDAPHPFLHKVIDKYGQVPVTLFSFYELYLKARGNYLGFHNIEGQTKGIYEEIEGRYNRKKKKFEGGLSDTDTHKKYGYLFGFGLPPKDALQKDYEGMPIMLPKGFFNREIQEGFKNLNIEGEERKSQPIFLLEKYLENDQQEFYTKKRHYTFKENHSLNNASEYEKQVKTLEGREKLDNNLKKYLSNLAQKLDKKTDKQKEKDIHKDELSEFYTLKEFRTYMLRTEKKLRYRIYQDRCLWLMAKQSLEKRIKQNERIETTSNLSLANIDTLLNSYVEMSVLVHEENNLDKEVVGKVAQRFFGDEKLTRTIIDEETKKEITQIVPRVFGEEEFNALKLKQYGDLRKFAKDKRLPDFFKYFPNAVLSKTQLERALDYLDTKRSKVFQKSLQLENLVHEKWGELGEDFENTEFGVFCSQPNSFIPHQEYIAFLEQKINFVADVGVESTQLNLFRNKIAHNQIPHNNYLQEVIDNIFVIDEDDVNTGKEFMRRLLDKIIEIYDKLLKCIKSI